MLWLRKAVYILASLALFAAATVSMMLPFLPFGWIFTFALLLLLTPYFKFLQSPLNWLSKKDKTGAFRGVINIVRKFYLWAHPNRQEDVKIMEKIVKRTK